VAREVVAEQGVSASMRDIARRSGVGLATLLRHFPTREALYEALLCTKLDALTQKASELQRTTEPEEALVSWLREWVKFVQSYKGVVTLMASAQKAGMARADMSGDDLFALMTALGWALDQPSFAPRADQLFHIIASAILTSRTSDDETQRRPPRKQRSNLEKSPTQSRSAR
jgi:AcrR family transcriptional regulator